MNAAELAKLLDGRDYRSEMTAAEEQAAKANNLVVVFGASDDLVEFRGAIDDEIGAYSGCEVRLNEKGIAKPSCDDEDCPYFLKAIGDCATISTRGLADGGWKFETKIKHETFRIYDFYGTNRDIYCTGIVFSMADLVESLKSKSKEATA